MRTKLFSAALISASLIVHSPVCRALITSADSINLVQRILGNIDTEVAQRELRALFMEGLRHKQDLKSAQIEAQNNAAANHVIRHNQQQTDIHNLALANKAQIAPNASEVIAATLSDACVTTRVASRLATEDTDRLKKIKLIGDKSAESDFTDQLLQVVQLSAPSMLTPSIEDDGKQTALSALDGHLLLSTQASVDTLSETDLQKAIALTNLIAPPYFPTAHELSLGTDTGQEKKVVEILTSLAAHNAPRQAAQSVLSKRVAGSTGLSELSSLQTFVDASYGRAGDMGDSAAYSIMSAQTLSATAVLRQYTIQRAFRAQMMERAFKVSLEHEALLAARLAQKLSKTK